MQLTEIHWDKDWELGIFYIDQQHKRLVNIVNKIAKSQLSNVYEFLSTLIQYASEHFTDEEHLMLNVDFPEITMHKNEHRLFTRALLEYSFRLNNGEDREAVHSEMSEFVAKWFAYHFLKTDKKLTTFIRGGGYIDKVKEFIEAKNNYIGA